MRHKQTKLGPIEVKQIEEIDIVNIVIVKSQNKKV